ncbi:MAG: radical SAM protein, partial [Candidatus Omnitrophota bacterium]
SLKKSGCHNINLVTASHYLPSVLEALMLWDEEPLDIPIVYNTSGYESKEVLEILDGIVDIYLADMRYCDNGLSQTYSQTKDYADVNKEAISAMYRQVGRLVVDEQGVAKTGLIIRHLVMPNLLRNTKEVLRFISEQVSKDSHVSLMAQYLPLHKAREFPEISRAITVEEYEEARSLLDEYGLTNGWIQDLKGQDR